MVEEAEPAGPAKGQITVVARDEGVLVLGARAEVDQYIASLRSRGASKLDDLGLATESLADATAAVSALAAVKATAGEYVRLSPKSIRLLKEQHAIPGSPGYFLGTVRTEGGKFAGLLEFQEVTMAAERALSLELAFATVALRAAINDVQQAVARVEDKVSDLAALTKAQAIGEVIAYHQMLAELVERTERTGRLPSVDWESVASLGPDLAKGVETLRKFLRFRVDNLDAGLPAQERSKRLRQAVEESRLGEVFQLLVVAEDSVYLWERLRIERARTRDSEQVSSIVESSQRRLTEDLRADGELVHDLRQSLTSYGTLRPLEVHRFRSRDKLERDVGLLRQELDEFVSARRMQVASWPPIGRPSLTDARQEIRRRAIETGHAARDVSARAVDLSAQQARRARQAVSRRMTHSDD
jgi:hypothetical protein